MLLPACGGRREEEGMTAPLADSSDVRPPGCELRVQNGALPRSTAMCMTKVTPVLMLVSFLAFVAGVGAGCGGEAKLHSSEEMLHKYRDYLTYDRKAHADETGENSIISLPPIRVVGVHPWGEGGLLAGEKGWLCFELISPEDKDTLVVPVDVGMRGDRPAIVPLLCEFYDESGEVVQVDVLGPPTGVRTGVHWRSIQLPAEPGRYRVEISMDSRVMHRRKNRVFESGSDSGVVVGSRTAAATEITVR